MFCGYYGFEHELNTVSVLVTMRIHIAALKYFSKDSGHLGAEWLGHRTVMLVVPASDPTTERKGRYL